MHAPSKPGSMARLKAGLRTGIQTLWLPGLIGLYLLATTYPFTLQLNPVALSTSSAEFKKPGLILWHEQPNMTESRRLAARFTLTPLRAEQTGPARILTISRDHHHANLTIGQEGKDLIVRLRRPGSSPVGNPSFDVEDLFASLEAHRVEVEVDTRAITIRIDDEVRLSEPLEGNPFALWDPTYPTALGNEHTWQRPWRGRIETPVLEVDRQRYELLDPNAISKPGFWHQAELKWVWMSSKIGDVLINFFAMIPFGFLSAFILRRDAVRRCMGLWLLVSLSVEVLQILIPGRTPAASDIVLNVLGVGVGAWLHIKMRGMDWMRHFPVRASQ